MEPKAQGQSKRTLGPVPDLERHLPAEWWRTLFNSIYLQTDGDVVENAANTSAEVDLLIAAADLSPRHHILDLCCGQGRHALELARRGFADVTGIDRSRYLVRLARRRAVESGLNITFQEGDARRVKSGPIPYDCVSMMGNSFGYFERIADDLAVLEAIRGALRPGGVLALDIVDGDWMREHFEPRSWEWIDQNHFVCRERVLSKDGDRIISREVVTHAERGVIADQFYAERLYSRGRISELLDLSGFGQITLHGSLQALSERNQDLGMMANRLFLTARTPVTKPATRTSPRPAQEVTVLLGDPRRPDMVKRDGRYNEEDLDTVRRMKETLAGLPDYTFRYLDDHSVLLETLLYDRPKLVLNLCDEGFANDAYREPHIPALLDLLGIPYTGAGPACLSLCYDKSIVRAVAMALDIPVPLETYVTPRDLAGTIPSIFPAFIKPAHGDGSLGISEASLVNSPEEAMATLDALREALPNRPLLVQEFLSGPEYTVGIIGNTGAGWTVLPILETDYSGLGGLPPILGHASKWQPDSPYWTKIRFRPASLDDDASHRIVDLCSQLFERLECRDYARFDFRTDPDGEIKLLEVNPNPGWCWDGKMNLMLELDGLSYKDLFAMILETARERLGRGNDGD